MKRFVFILMAIFLLAGCVHLRPGPPATPEAVLIKGTVQLGVAQYVAGQPARAAEAERLVAQLKEHVEAGVEISVGSLQALAMEWVPWERLDLQGRIIVMSLIQASAQYLEEQVGTGVLEPTDTVPVLTLLGWIDEVLVLAQLGGG